MPTARPSVPMHDLDIAPVDAAGLGAVLKTALDAQAAARDLAGAALGLSLDAQATVFEMAAIVATLR